MSNEQPSRSEGFGSHEEWEVAAMVGEITILPLEILGDIAGEAMEGFSDD